jgi:RsiW-degrading membrane proteinase PrsW (M82 family)
MGPVTTLIGGSLAVIVGVVPMVVYGLILWWFDRYEKEPLALLVASFLWGAIPAVIFSLIAELALGVPVSRLVRPATASLVEAAVVAPVAEEVFKGAALLLLLFFFQREVDSAIDGILYGGLVGFGFAAVENTLYFASGLMEEGLGGFAALALFRAFIFGLNHALFTGLLGLGLAWGYTTSSAPVKVGAPAVGLLAAITSHAVHNASVTLGAEFGWPCLIAFASDWGGVLILVAVVVWYSVRERRWIGRWLDEEVERGTLSQTDYEVASSYLARLMARAQTLLSGDLGRWWRLGRYYQLATELAFSKHRLSRFPQEEDTQESIERLRKQVSDLGTQLVLQER